MFQDLQKPERARTEGGKVLSSRFGGKHVCVYAANIVLGFASLHLDECAGHLLPRNQDGINLDHVDIVCLFGNRKRSGFCGSASEIIRSNQIFMQALFMFDSITAKMNGRETISIPIHLMLSSAA